MNDVVIRVENLCKEYRLGTISHGTLYRDIQSGWAKLRGTEDPNARIGSVNREQLNNTNDRFCALKDVSFDVRQGEIVGIIGRNGAGKSTLLKIISRVTAPTSGTIKIKGRVASLLEVGTGFHPELTGRENIFLNGAILGMHKGEIEQKFDEIVAFSEIDKFIDTPVKRYSSGMYVRLAFAVAAHLDPEILVVDEVLAVGDAAFQKKCLGKMGEISKEGRTVLFVSHNMGAIQRLCNRTILLSEGQVTADGGTSSVVELYMTTGLSPQGERIWTNLNAAPGNEIVRLKAVRALNNQQNIVSQFSVREPVYLEVEYCALTGGVILDVGFYLYDATGALLFAVGDTLTEEWQGKPRPKGEYRTRCEIPGDLLNEGQLRIMAFIVTNPNTVHAIENDALLIQIVDDLESGGARGNYTGNWPGGAVRPLLKWTTEYKLILSADMR
jgi:lipopolysaccharide transport system ATP-binding protein